MADLLPQPVRGQVKDLLKPLLGKLVVATYSFVSISDGLTCLDGLTLRRSRALKVSPSLSIVQRALSLRVGFGLGTRPIQVRDY